MSERTNEQGKGDGGWNGWRLLVVSERVRESDTITSFVLTPKDGRPLPKHRPGQYLTLLVDIAGSGERKRTYTISNGPNRESYRITVKRDPDGTVSRWLHDMAQVGTELRVAPPAGDFILPAEQDRPIVLLSAGVGLTPMVSMLEAIVQRNSPLETFYLHGTRDRSTHAMADHVRSLAAERPTISVTTFYSRPQPDDVPGRDFDERGQITVEWLRQHAPAEADYFICGPVPFLRTFVGGLTKSGIRPERIHYEFFGAVDALLADWPEALDVVTGQAAPPLAEPPAAQLPHVSRHEVGEAFLGTQADAVIVSDRDGLITLWNPGAERIFGFAETQAIGQSLDIIIPEALRGRHWEGYRETVASGRSRYGAGDLLAVPALRKDGTRISTEFTITMLKSADGEVTGMIAVLRDVTARFEEARALRKRIAELEAKV